MAPLALNNSHVDLLVPPAGARVLRLPWQGVHRLHCCLLAPHLYHPSTYPLTSLQHPSNTPKGEAARLLCHCAGIPLKDTRLARDEFTTMKVQYAARTGRPNPKPRRASSSAHLTL